MTIRIITEPTVAVIGRMSFDRDALQPYLDSIGAGGWQTDAESGGDALAETAGRICYRSFATPRPGGNAAYLERIKSEGHGSVCEHAYFSLLLTGISRNLTHEFVRHRAGFAYSMRSQRFVDESSADFVVPPEYAGEVSAARDYIARVVTKRPGATALDISSDMRNMNRPTPEEEAGLTWLAAVEHSRRSYAALSAYGIRKRLDAAWVASGGVPRQESGGRQAYLDRMPAEEKTAIRKKAREAARSVLPGCTATELVVTGNARAWRHWLEMRGSAHAEAEIRRLALAVLPVLQREAPNIFGDYSVVDGSIVTNFRKV